MVPSYPSGSANGSQTPSFEGLFSSRQINFCPTLRASFSDEKLVTACPRCGSYHVLCCRDDTIKRVGELPEIKAFTSERTPCHWDRLAMIDGCCLNNGSPSAVAGLGISTGTSEYQHYSILVSTEIDGTNPRTSQRAELLAAIVALDILAAETSGENERNLELKEEKLGRKHARGEESARRGWILRTDSEYLFKGVTEWFPKWKKNSWRTSLGKTATNLDIFQAIDQKILKYEEEFNVQIGIWKVSRNDNQEADELAKQGARKMDL